MNVCRGYNGSIGRAKAQCVGTLGV